MAEKNTIRFETADKLDMSALKNKINELAKDANSDFKNEQIDFVLNGNVKMTIKAPEARDIRKQIDGYTKKMQQLMKGQRKIELDMPQVDTDSIFKNWRLDKDVSQKVNEAFNFDMKSKNANKYISENKGNNALREAINQKKVDMDDVDSTRKNLIALAKMKEEAGRLTGDVYDFYDKASTGKLTGSAQDIERQVKTGLEKATKLQNIYKQISKVGNEVNNSKIYTDYIQNDSAYSGVLKQIGLLDNNGASVQANKIVNASDVNKVQDVLKAYNSRSNTKAYEEYLKPSLVNSRDKSQLQLESKITEIVSNYLRKFNASDDTRKYFAEQKETTSAKYQQQSESYKKAISKVSEEAAKMYNSMKQLEGIDFKNATDEEFDKNSVLMKNAIAFANQFSGMPEQVQSQLMNNLKEKGIDTKDFQRMLNREDFKDKTIQQAVGYENKPLANLTNLVGDYVGMESTKSTLDSYDSNAVIEALIQQINSLQRELDTVKNRFENQKNISEADVEKELAPNPKEETKASEPVHESTSKEEQVRKEETKSQSEETPKVETEQANENLNNLIDTEKIKAEIIALVNEVNTELAKIGTVELQSPAFIESIQKELDILRENITTTVTECEEKLSKLNVDVNTIGTLNETLDKTQTQSENNQLDEKFNSVLSSIDNLVNKFSDYTNKKEEDKKETGKKQKEEPKGARLSDVENNQIEKIMKEGSTLQGQIGDLKSIQKKYKYDKDGNILDHSYTLTGTKGSATIGSDYKAKNSSSQLIDTKSYEKAINDYYNLRAKLARNNGVDLSGNASDRLSDIRTQIKAYEQEMSKLPLKDYSKIMENIHTNTAEARGNYEAQLVRNEQDRIKDIVKNETTLKNELAKAESNYRQLENSNTNTSNTNSLEAAEQRVNRIKEALSLCQTQLSTFNEESVNVVREALNQQETLERNQEKVTTKEESNRARQDDLEAQRQINAELQRQEGYYQEIAQLENQMDNAVATGSSDRIENINAHIQELNNNLQESNGRLNEFGDNVQGLGRERIDEIQSEMHSQNEQENRQAKIEAGNKLDSYTDTLNGLQTDDLVQRTEQFQRKVAELNEYLERYRNLVTSTGGVNDVFPVEEARAYEAEIEDIIQDLNRANTAQSNINSGVIADRSQIDAVARRNLEEINATDVVQRSNVRDYVTGNSTVTYEYRDADNGLQRVAYQYDALGGVVNRVSSTSIKEMNGVTKAIQNLGTKWSTIMGYQLAMYLDPFQIIEWGRRIVDTVVNLDDALVDLKKTAQGSAQELNNFYFDANKVAKDYGSTTQEVIQQAADWSRLGYNLNDSKLMSQLSSQMTAISPGGESSEITNSLVSVMQAYQSQGINAQNVKKEVMDKINIIGNNFATTNVDILEGLRQSSSALVASGATLEENIAMFTGAQEIVQNASTVGSALKTISMRIRGMNEESEQLDSGLINIKSDISDLTKTAKTPMGISLMEDQDTFKSIYDILGEIADIYDDLTDKNRAKLLEKLFAKTRMNVGASMLENWSQVKSAMDTMQNESLGSADKEMSTIQESLSFKINALKQTWVGFAQSFADRGLLSDAIGLLTGLSEAITNVIKAIGLLPSAGIALAGFLGLKNLGKTNYYKLSLLLY